MVSVRVCGWAFDVWPAVIPSIRVDSIRFRQRKDVSEWNDGCYLPPSCQGS